MIDCEVINDGNAKLALSEIVRLFKMSLYSYCLRKSANPDEHMELVNRMWPDYQSLMFLQFTSDTIAVLHKSVAVNMN